MEGHKHIMIFCSSFVINKTLEEVVLEWINWNSKTRWVLVFFKSSLPNLCSAFIWALILALSMFFTEQRDIFRIFCHLIGWKKSLSVRLFWKLSLSHKNSLWDQISIDGEPSYWLKSSFSTYQKVQNYNFKPFT